MFLHDPYFLIRGGLYLAACEFLYRIYSRPRGPQEVFRVSWSYRGLTWISVEVSTYFLWQIATGHASRTLNSIWTWAFFILAPVCLSQFPRVVTANEAGVEQRRLVLRRKFIGWSDVTAVTQHWEKNPFDPFSGGQSTMILGCDGTEIRFSEWNVKQDRFEWWIRNHIPPQCFASELPKSITGD